MALQYTSPPLQYSIVVQAVTPRLAQSTAADWLQHWGVLCPHCQKLAIVIPQRQAVCCCCAYDCSFAP
jgi:hypothetical protein